MIAASSRNSQSRDNEIDRAIQNQGGNKWRARTARPGTSGRYPGHPPALWIAGMYRHCGSGASRRVPFGGAYPGLSRRAWIARDSESAGQPSASACHAALPLRTAHHSSWVGHRAGPCQRRGPSPAVDPASTHRARALPRSCAGGGTHRARALHHQSAGGGTDGLRA